MTRKMTVGAAMAAFFGTILAASAAGVVYTAEETNRWFTVTASEANFDNSEWEKPTDGVYSKDGDNIVFDTDATDPLKYRPSGTGSGPIALVNVQMVVDPNASMPSTNGLSAAQAALSVVTNATNGSLKWVGLTKENDELKWVELSGGAPTSGAIYDVQIAIDNRSANPKGIRYAVKVSGAASYTILTNGDNDWLVNPQSGTTNVTAVAFAGTGKVGDFSGDNVIEAAATVGDFTNSLGYDFTNGTVTAVVTIPSGVYDGKQAVLTVRDTEGNTTQYREVITGASSSVSFDLSALTSGAAYSYDLSVDFGGGDVRPGKSGTFVAANWLNDDYWFFAYNNTTKNGSFVGAEFNSTKWDVVTNAQFVVDNTSSGTGKVIRVDTSYSFDTFIDPESLERLTDAVGGIVAVSNGVSASWYAFTGVENDTAGWQELAGDVVPAMNASYVVRAEFDFASASNKRRVRYSVSPNSGSFSPLTLNGVDWISLASDSACLSSVSMSGKGSVASIYATLASTAVAKNSAGTKFDTLWQALSSKTEGITLLTNATLKPENVTGGKFGPFSKDGFEVFLDKSGLTGTWKIVEKDGVFYLMKPAATYIFF